MLRCKFLDRLCLFISLFGTTTSYVIIIPLIFIFYSRKDGCEAMSVLTLAIYISSLIKVNYQKIFLGLLVAKYRGFKEACNTNSFGKRLTIFS